MQVLIAISGFCGFCSRIGNAPCTTPFDFLFVISIHVPAWGTTADVSKTDSTFQKDFNPRSRVGNDLNMRADDDGFIDFNPRSRVGNDRMENSLVRRTTYFNPRSRVGIDSEKKKRQHFIPISIHVPAWGTTPVSPFSSDSFCYFNPRSRVGNDRRSR